MNSKCMEMAALGRPLYVGMLYDCRSDSFIPGVTLWNKQSIMKDLDVYQKPNTDLSISTSDTLSEKANLLDISVSLKASFLGGLLQVSGSANYMHDTKSSEHQCRITMQYCHTTRFEQLTMTELRKVTYPQVFDQQTATHVVTAVLYGAQAFMLFDYETSDEQNKEEVNGTLHVLVNKFLSADGEGKLKLTDEEKELAKNMNVKFHGDYELEENPTSFDDALKTYKELPSLLKKTGNNGVPQRVWLYPLNLLDDKAAKLVREISASVISETDLLLEELREVERMCNDLVNDIKLKDFPCPTKRMKKFQTLQSDYKLELQKKLSMVLPSVRGGTQDEKELDKILIDHSNSPFTCLKLKMWLDDSTTELNMLKSYTRDLNSITVVNSLGSLNSILFDPALDVVLCLSFTSLNYNDPYLEDLQKYLKKFEAGVSDSEPNPHQWFNSPEISKRMRQNLFSFLSFSKGNANEKRMKFIIASISDADNPGSSIRLYEQGGLTDPKFIPVSKPPPPTAEIKGESVNLKLQKSPTGETLEFRVEYKLVKEDGNEKPEEPWEYKNTQNANTDYTLTGLQTGCQYLIRYKAVSAVGLSEASDSVTVFEMGLMPLIVAGDADGAESFLISGATLKMITITKSDHQVNSLKVKFSNNEEKTFGFEEGKVIENFELNDCDRFQSLYLYTVFGNLAGIYFTVESPSEKPREFGEKLSLEDFKEASINIVPVGPGICCGVKVKNDRAVESLGFYFLK